MRYSLTAIWYWGLNGIGFMVAALGTAIAITPSFQSSTSSTYPTYPTLNLGYLDEFRKDILIADNNSQGNYPAIFPRSDEIPKNLPKQPTLPATPSDSQTQLLKTPEIKKLKLSVSDVVYLVLANNTEIKNAYLERIAQKQDLAVAEDKFVPDFTPTLSISANQLDSTTLTGGKLGLNIDAKVVVKVPTGAELSFKWIGNANGNAINNNTDTFIRGTSNDLNQNFQVDIKQPLLRGAGSSVNRASVNIAKFNEKVNIQSLRNTLIETITNAIIGYRELLQAQEKVKIEQLSLQNAEESLEVTKVLIAGGKVAPVDIVQNQTDIANRRVSLLASQNDVESKRLALLTILDIDKNTQIEASALPEIKQIPLDLAQLQKTALQNQPNYIRSQLAVEVNKLNLLIAQDDRRWDLSLNASIADGNNQETDARAGLTLSRTIGDLTLKQRYERTRVDLLKSENTLKNETSRLDIQVQDRVRDVNQFYTQLELARLATKLSQQQLDIEQEKRKLGRGANIFQLIRLQNELVLARNSELDATIRYLNALTSLDRLLGTTLDTWQVAIE